MRADSLVAVRMAGFTMSWFIIVTALCHTDPFYHAPAMWTCITYEARRAGMKIFLAHQCLEAFMDLRSQA